MQNIFVELVYNFQWKSYSISDDMYRKSFIEKNKFIIIMPILITSSLKSFYNVFIENIKPVLPK